VIDLHSHILPGIDDGARTMADSVGIARDAVSDGVTTMVATPHVREDYPTGGETMERLVGEVRDELRRAGIPLEVKTGGEVAMEQLIPMGIDELRRFSLGGGGRYVLVEFPYHGWPLPLPSQVERLHGLGLTAIIAHPERSGEVQGRPGRLGPLVDAGALVQLTAASVDGRLGRASRAAAMRLLEMGLAHVVASDAHMPGTRAAGLSSAVVALGGGPLARWLTHDVPSAIVDGDPIPRRPPEQPRRRRWALGG
jgi:protein-tyrosine phosphatase